jgi:hypothetical protein
MSDDLLLEGEPERRPSAGEKRRGRRFILWLAGLIVVFLALYYPVGAMLVHKIDDDPNFAPAEVPQGASHAVAMAAALIEREVGDHAWPGNDPWFFPGYILDNMPNYQQGIIQALRRFSLEMTDQIGRARGSSQADADLDRARSLLGYEGNIWVWDFSVSWWPTAPSDQQYMSARDALLSYNRRLAAGSAVFDRRSDNLLATLDRIGKDLGSASAGLEQRVESHAGAWIDVEADDRFYRTKGELYGYALLLRELGKDFESVLQERALQKLWNEMLGNLAEAASLRPWVVTNGAPDGQVLPNHLVAQGFFLLRARAQIYEISDVLLK